MRSQYISFESQKPIKSTQLRGFFITGSTRAIVENVTLYNDSSEHCGIWLLPELIKTLTLTIRLKSVSNGLEVLPEAAFLSLTFALRKKHLIYAGPSK